MEAPCAAPWSSRRARGRPRRAAHAQEAEAADDEHVSGGAAAPRVHDFNVVIFGHFPTDCLFRRTAPRRACRDGPVRDRRAPRMPMRQRPRRTMPEAARGAVLAGTGAEHAGAACTGGAARDRGARRARGARGRR
jgi:hypothetical protein